MSTSDLFNAALDALVGQIETDRTILAAILCGSLSHDTVWEKSDIDLVLVTIDDKAADRQSVAIDADGINVHAFLLTRTAFRQTVEGTVRNSFIHSLLAKGRLLYSHDASITALVAGLTEIGARDRRLQLLVAGMSAIAQLHKARKWLVTRGDLDYSALWLLYAATPLAQIELLLAGRLVAREVIPEAAEINPDFFAQVYSGLLGTPNSESAIRAALDAADRYMIDRILALFGLVIDHLREVGEARSATEIDNHFARHYGLPHVTTACEYLAESGVIGRAGTPVRLTSRSNVDVQELAFFAYS